MARFDIYRRLARSRWTIPFLIDVQNNRLSSLRTRIVIPLRSIPPHWRVAIKDPPDLFPLLHVEGADYFLTTTELGAIDLAKLGPFVISGVAYQNAVQASLDRVFGSH
jgi:toxin CcdB